MSATRTVLPLIDAEKDPDVLTRRSSRNVTSAGGTKDPLGRFQLKTHTGSKTCLGGVATPYSRALRGNGCSVSRKKPERGRAAISLGRRAGVGSSHAQAPAKSNSKTYREWRRASRLAVVARTHPACGLAVRRAMTINGPGRSKIPRRRRQKTYYT